MTGMQIALADGTPIKLRPVLPSDKEKLDQWVGRMSPAARRQRFFSAVNQLSTETLTYLTEVDYTNHFAWLALAVNEPDEPVVGVGRYVRVADTDVAEIAFVVGEAFQGKGLATILFELLTIVARSNGITRFKALVLADNVPMRHMLTEIGARFHHDEAGVLRTSIALPKNSTQFERLVGLHAAAR